ncbi:hypothetical protein CBL_10054 [Carabus blaptoides fortunei]
MKAQTPAVSQQLLLAKVNAEQEAATRASFRVAHSIAKHGKPFTDDELIKDCIIVAGEEMSLSADAVARRVDDIAEYILTKLSDKNQYSEWFSLALDESTDVSDTAQVLLFIRGIDKDMKCMKSFTYEDDIDEDDIQAGTLPFDVPGTIKIFTNVDAGSDKLDNIPLSMFRAYINSGKASKKKEKLKTKDRKNC